MTNPMMLEVNAQTGEAIIREMTDTEYAQQLEMVEQFKEQQELNPNSVV